MTDHDTTNGGDDVHALSGVYAVDALEPDERTAFEAHLSECADCREEVDSLREAAALLGTDDVAPPAALRDRLLSDIASIRPLPPLPAPSVVVEPLPAPVQLASRRRVASRLPLMMVAAAAVLIAAVGGLWQPWANQPDEQPRLTAAERVLAADDAARFDKSFPDGATATVVISRSEGRAVILTEDMGSAPDGKDYQLWLQTPAGELEPAGLMPDISDATVLLDGDASRATGVGITVEPDGGSDRPTSQPIAFYSLDS